jgi:hypothetical protein
MLGTLLVAAVIAGIRSNTQNRAAERRLEGCRIANECLSGWWTDRQNFPRSSGGDVDGHPGWKWQTRPVASTEAAALQADVVALDILAPGDGPPGPAVTVEVLLPRESHEIASGTNAG